MSDEPQESLFALFTRLANQCSYSSKLKGEILYWASCVPGTATTWSAIESQIKFMAEQSQGRATPHQVIESLFQCQSADDFMLNFQL